MRSLSRTSISALVAIISAWCPWATARADIIEWHQWSYACAKDHTDPYGTVLNPANCWASICEGVKHSDEYGLGDSCLSVFEFTREGKHLGQVRVDELCEPRPTEIAVDGKRIDLLSDDQQIDAARKGKHIIRRVQGRGWPYCKDVDIEADLSGADYVYKQLVKMSPKFLGN